MNDTTYHERRLARRLEDPAFRAEYERALHETRTIDSIVGLRRAATTLGLVAAYLRSRGSNEDAAVAQSLYRQVVELRDRLT